MKSLIKVIGVLWAVLGVINVVASPAIGGSAGPFIFLFNMVLFVLPGLGMYALGTQMKS